MFHCDLARLNVQANSHSPLNCVRTRTTSSWRNRDVSFSPDHPGFLPGPYLKKEVPPSVVRVVPPRYTMLFPLRWPV